MFREQVLRRVKDQVRNAGRYGFVQRRAVGVICGYQSRKKYDASPSDDKIAEATSEITPAYLEYAQPPSLRAVLEGVMFQTYNSVHKALKIQVIRFFGQIVEKQHGAARCAK